MDFSALKLPSFKLPAGLLGAKPASGAGLVIRQHAVEVVTMQHGKPAKHVRVLLEGAGDMSLLRAIERALAAAECTTKRLAVSLASQDILVRYFTMPAIPKSEWESAAQFEVRKYIPFKTDSLVWDCSVMQAQSKGAGAPGERLEVVFAAISREAFAQTLSVLATAGIQPTVVEPLSASLAQMVPAGRKLAEHQFVCLVDVEPGQAHLAIVRDGVPFLTRDVNLGAGQGDAGAGSASAEHWAQRMLSELSVSIDFFRREYPGAAVSKIVLFGDERLLEAWPQQFAGALPCPVELGTALLASQAPGAPLMFAAAVGLLQRRRGRGAVALDFLKRMRPAGSTAASGAAQKAAAVLSSATTLDLETMKALLKTPRALAMAAGCVGLLVAVWMFGSLRVTAAQRSLDQMLRSGSGAGARLEGKSPAEITALQALVLEQLAFLKQTIDQRTPLAAKLDGLARSLPDGVWLTDLTFEDRLEAGGQGHSRMVVRGACYLGASGEEIAAIQDFEERVKHNPSLFKGFTAARLDQIDAETDRQQFTYRTFQLQCQSSQRM